MNAIIRILFSPYLIFGPRRSGSGSRRVRDWLTLSAHSAVVMALVVCKNSVGVIHNRLLRRAGKMLKSTSGGARGLLSIIESAVQFGIKASVGE
ncbi:MAG: hypothetical protein Q8P40_07340 [Nitrospirota bacterium]|nr:hypothetical protein [Nitrospirota bacterium]